MLTLFTFKNVGKSLKMQESGTNKRRKKRFYIYGCSQGKCLGKRPRKISGYPWNSSSTAWEETLNTAVYRHHGIVYISWNCTSLFILCITVNYCC